MRTASPRCASRMWCARPTTRSRSSSMFRHSWPSTSPTGAGQYLALRVEVGGQGVPPLLFHRRPRRRSTRILRVTVKRDRDGRGVQLAQRQCRTGDRIKCRSTRGVASSAPDSGRELVASAGGSGITPVFSLIQTRTGALRRPGAVVVRQPWGVLGHLAGRRRSTLLD